MFFKAIYKFLSCFFGSRRLYKVVSYKDLIDLEACSFEVDRFVRTFGLGAIYGVKLTYENIKAAEAAGLSVDWFAYQIMPADCFEFFKWARRMPGVNQGSGLVFEEGTFTPPLPENAAWATECLPS